MKNLIAGTSVRLSVFGFLYLCTIYVKVPEYMAVIGAVLVVTETYFMGKGVRQ